jgi:hypothetical protein
MVKAMAPAIQQPDVPAEIRAASGMDRPDYVDLFSVATGKAADASPEQWARTAVEEVAGLGGQFIWRILLGLRLEASPARIGGWRIAEREHDWIRLEESSWFLTAHLVFRLENGMLSVATFIRYDLPFAALVWIPASAVHRSLVPGLLRDTVRKRWKLKREDDRSRSESTDRRVGVIRVERNCSRT